MIGNLQTSVFPNPATTCIWTCMARTQLATNKIFKKTKTKLAFYLVEFSIVYSSRHRRYPASRISNPITQHVHNLRNVQMWFGRV